jgi:hypothetical protein
VIFILTALVYPVVLAVLCAGAGLLVERASGRFLPGALLPPVGAAALIGASQLSTYAWPLAPATPYVMVALAVAGFLFAWGRVLMLARRWRAWTCQIVAPVLVYILALAPVLFAGRPPSAAGTRTHAVTCALSKPKRRKASRGGFLKWPGTASISFAVARLAGLGLGSPGRVLYRLVASRTRART